MELRSRSSHQNRELASVKKQRTAWRDGDSGWVLLPGADQRLQQIRSGARGLVLGRLRVDKRVESALATRSPSDARSGQRDPHLLLAVQATHSEWRLPGAVERRPVVHAPDLSRLLLE